MSVRAIQGSDCEHGLNMSGTGDEHEKGVYQKYRQLFKQEKKNKTEVQTTRQQEKKKKRKEKNMAILRADMRMED